ncbi:transposase family protein [Streptomyces sp. NPDC002561]|uniref:transposase family protein n=1 Tax=unclassified Streptomyces TaxID=2593676 RepID=UPI00332EA2B6
MLVHPSGLDLSTSALRLLRRKLTARRRRIGTRWRRLTCGRQALMTLAHLRCGHTFAQLAAGFGVGLATAHRYVTEAVDVLAVLAPTLQQAMAVAARKAFVILDGTLPPIDRIAADRPFCSGKHRMNVQVLTDPFGKLIRASPALAGSVHDIRAARSHGLLDALNTGGIRCWADKAYQGSGPASASPSAATGTSSPPGRRPSTAPTRRSAHSAATLKSWRLLRKLRCSTTRITDLVKAVLTLELTASTRGGSLAASYTPGVLDTSNLFHVSSVLNRQSIAQHGLDWTRMGAARGIAGSRRPEVEGIFVCRGEEEAGFFLQINNTGGPVDIWSVDGIDEGLLLDNGNGFVYLPGSIPAARVRLV